MSALRETAYDPVHDAQRHFRALLDATARPGTLARLPDVQIQPPPDLHPASALLGLALLDGDAPFHVAGGRAAAAEYLRLNTGAPLAETDAADFLFARGRGDEDACRRAKIGSLRYPEGGATLVVDVERLDAEAGADGLALTLKGPGIPGQRGLGVWGLNPVLLEIRLEKNDEFPTGIDLFLADAEGHLCSLPRTAQVRWTRT